MCTLTQKPRQHCHQHAGNVAPQLQHLPAALLGTAARGPNPAKCRRLQEPVCLLSLAQPELEAPARPTSEELTSMMFLPTGCVLKLHLEGVDLGPASVTLWTHHHPGPRGPPGLPPSLDSVSSGLQARRKLLSWTCPRTTSSSSSSRDSPVHLHQTSKAWEIPLTMST